MFDGNNWFIKGSLTLIPDKGKAIAWSAYARKSESYPGVVYFSLILSDADISLDEGIEDRLINIYVHPYYEHRYVYPAFFIEDQKPKFHIESEKKKLWDGSWEEVNLCTELAYKDSPNKSNKTYPVKTSLYRIIEDKEGKNPLWPVVEELIERESEAEDLGIPEKEIEEFIEQILFSKEGMEVYDQEGLFLISPKAMIYKNKEGKTLVRKGDYGTWAIVNTGIREGSTFSIYSYFNERGSRVWSRIYRINTKNGVLFGAMEKFSDWTRIWNLALSPNGVEPFSDETIQNLVLVMEGERTSPEALVP
jgi:hypothetical protein